MLWIEKRGRGLGALSLGGVARFRVYRDLPMRLAPKPGRPKSAAFFDNLLTRFNRYAKTLRARETRRGGRRRLAHPS